MGEVDAIVLIRFELHIVLTRFELHIVLTRFELTMAPGLLGSWNHGYCCCYYFCHSAYVILTAATTISLPLLA